MTKEFSFGSFPNSTVVAVGVGFATLGGEPCLHSGIAFTCEGEEWFLHLLWHYKLKCQTPPDNFLYADPSIGETRKRVVANVCALIWKQRPNLAFGLGARTGARFQLAPNGSDIELVAGENGMTCASFVLEVFDCCDLTMLNLSNWDLRDEDREWQDKVLQLLEKESPDHAAFLRRNPAPLRVRPNEVAGSAPVKPWPVATERAREAGLQVSEMLSRT